MTPYQKRKKEIIYVAVEKQQSKSKSERKWKTNEETGLSLREIETGSSKTSKTSTYW